MSVQAGAVCYSDAAAAAAAVASGEVGRVVPAGGTVYVVEAVANAAGSITYTLNDAGGGAAVVSSMTPTFPECGLLQAADAGIIGWLLVGVWASVYGVMMLRRAWQ